MKMRGLFKRLICFALAIGIILPNASNLIINVCADEATITQLIWLEPMPGLNNVEYDVIAEEEIYEEITYETNFYDTTHQSENNWYLLNKYDLLPYNEIHKVSVKYPLVYHSSKICCIIESKQVHRPDEND